MFTVRYKLGVYIPEDGILHSHSSENLKAYTSWHLPVASQEKHQNPQQGYVVSGTIFEPRPLNMKQNVQRCMKVMWDLQLQRDELTVMRARGVIRGFGITISVNVTSVKTHYIPLTQAQLCIGSPWRRASIPMCESSQAKCKLFRGYSNSVISGATLTQVDGRRTACIFHLRVDHNYW
jgi:hypothetical protein